MTDADHTDPVDRDADDWAPLAGEKRISHPGELVDAALHPETPGQAPSIAAVEAPQAVMAEPDPAGQAIRELKARIANSGPSTSLVAEVLHREERQERQQRAVANANNLVVVPKAAVEAPTTPEMEIDTAAADIDPRETEPWFRELPRAEQNRLRTHWWYERHRNDDIGVRLRRRLGRSIAYGALLFFVMSILLALLLGGLALVPVMTAAGALAAGVAEMCGGGRFIYAAAGGLAFVAVMGPVVFIQPLSLASLMLAIYGMASIGMDGEMRRSGGFERK